jgi:hypothetical protein
VGPYETGHRDPEALGHADADAALEHLVVGALDLVEDAAVEGGRGLDAVAAGRV